jgi:hypothetical protein
MSLADKLTEKFNIHEKDELTSTMRATEDDVEEAAKFLYNNLTYEVRQAIKTVAKKLEAFLAAKTSISPSEFKKFKKKSKLLDANFLSDEEFNFTDKVAMKKYRKELNKLK